MTWVSETMEVDGVKLGVRRLGEGNPLVILYGDQLDTQVPPFDDAMAGRFRAVVPSLPGVNQSELPDWIEDHGRLGLPRAGSSRGPGRGSRGHRRPRVRRLGGGGDGGALAATHPAPGVDRFGGHQSFGSHRARRAGRLRVHGRGGRRAGVARRGSGQGAEVAGHGGCGGRGAARAAAQPPVGAEVRLASPSCTTPSSCGGWPGCGCRPTYSGARATGW